MQSKGGPAGKITFEVIKAIKDDSVNAQSQGAQKLLSEELSEQLEPDARDYFTQQVLTYSSQVFRNARREAMRRDDRADQVVATKSDVARAIVITDVSRGVYVSKKHLAIKIAVVLASAILSAFMSFAVGSPALGMILAGIFAFALLGALLYFEHHMGGIDRL